MQFKVSIAAAAATLGLATLAQADGLTLRLEGGLGYNFGEGVGIFSIVRDAPATSTSQLDFQDGIARGPLSLSYRAEANWAFTLGNGLQMRVGGILSGTDGSSHEETPIYAGVFTRPGGAEPALPEGEIIVCSFPDPCATFKGDLDRSYHEIMPELMFGRDGANGTTTWVGLQGFSGDLSEHSVNNSERLAPAPPQPRTTITDMQADTTGILLAVQQSRPLDSGMLLLLGAGLGTYRINATGFTDYLESPGHRKDVTGEFDGVRAQLMVGVEKPLSDRLTIGATVRADHWSDQPRIKMDWDEPQCNPSLCEPPKRDGNFNLETDPFTSLTFGLALTWRL